MAEKDDKSELYSVVNKPKPLPAGAKDEIRVVLIGRTGEGKSATANTVFGKDVFTSEARGMSVTANCDYHTGEVKQHSLCMIDTPGLFDTQKTNEEVKKGIFDYLATSSPGPHVFLVVIKVGRYTEEQGKTYQAVCELFGDEMHQFSIVVLTGGDDLEYHKKTADDYLKSAPDGLKEIIKKTDNRFVVFNNRAIGPGNEKQVECLLETMDNLIEANNYYPYSPKIYMSVEKAIQKIENRDAITKEKEQQANALKQKFKLQKAELEKKETRARALSGERKKEQYRSSQFINLEREYEAKLRNLEDKYKKQLREAREQVRNDIQTNKIDTTEPWFKEHIKEAQHKLKSLLGL